MKKESFTISVSRKEAKTLLQLVYMGEAVAEGGIMEEKARRPFVSIAEKVFIQYACYKDSALPEKITPRRIGDLRDRQGDYVDRYVQVFKSKPLIEHLVRENRENMAEGVNEGYKKIYDAIFPDKK